MGVASPELMAAVFTERFNSRDAEGLMELYTEDAVFTYDGVEKATGKAQIDGALAGFLAAGLIFSGEYVSACVTRDTALMRMRWELREGTGKSVASGISTEVMRRSADGMWRFLIDDAAGGTRDEA
jgi:uncharacterized protein (TIGR02246 family)